MSLFFSCDRCFLVLESSRELEFLGASEELIWRSLFSMRYFDLLNVSDMPLV